MLRKQVFLFKFLFEREVISSQRVIGINFIRKGNFDSGCISFNGHLVVSILYL